MHEQIVRSPEFFKLMRAVNDRAYELHIRNIANIVWGLAKLNYLPESGIMETLCNEIRLKAMDGVAQNIAKYVDDLLQISVFISQSCDVD